MGNKRKREVPLLLQSPTPDCNPCAAIEKGTFFVNAVDWSVDPKTDEIYLKVCRDGKEVTVPFRDLAANKADPTPLAPKNASFYTQSDYMEFNRFIQSGLIISRELAKDVGRVKEAMGNDSITVQPSYVGFAKRGPDVRGFAMPSSKEIYLNLYNKNFSGNIYMLKSIFRHEAIHLTEKIRMTKLDKYGNSKRSYRYIEHAVVYFEQMKYPEFLECPADFQVATIYGFCLRLWYHIEKDNIHGFDELNKYRDQFNQYFRAGRKNSKGEVLTVTITTRGKGHSQKYELDHITFSYSRKKKGERSGMPISYVVNSDFAEKNPLSDPTN